MCMCCSSCVAEGWVLLDGLGALRRGELFLCFRHGIGLLRGLGFDGCILKGRKSGGLKRTPFNWFMSYLWLVFGYVII